jgi:CubicO group peptidase (beta-lactamase class C family)
MHRRAFLMLAAAGISRTAWATPVFPDGEWSTLPRRSVPQDDALVQLLRAGDTTGVLVIKSGRVLFEYGNVREASYIASVRKSLVSMLYGKYVNNGSIPLTKTLRALGIDEKGGLLASERDATIGDLLSARSGVYHPAANLGDASDRAPARGSVKPGTYFLYNNWDFNALGGILEQETRRSLYDLFTSDIATPIALQDWNTTPGAHRDMIRNDTGLSRFPAHHFVLSTRDMARIGYLMLRNGRWGTRQVIPSDWVEQSTRVVTPADEVARTSPFIAGLGYGYLWWRFDGEPFRSTPLHGGYTASGAFGQYITIIPTLDVVIAHKTAVPPPRNLPNETYFGTILPAIAVLAHAVTP